MLDAHLVGASHELTQARHDKTRKDSHTCQVMEREQKLTTRDGDLYRLNSQIPVGNILPKGPYFF